LVYTDHTLQRRSRFRDLLHVNRLQVTRPVLAEPKALAAADFPGMLRVHGMTSTRSMPLSHEYAVAEVYR
jgi:hypothetical protein